MKVLQINSVCGIRSTGRICTDIAELLEQSGIQCKIGYGRSVLPSEYKSFGVKIGSKFDVSCHMFISRLFDCMGAGSKFATRRFLTWVENYDPDIIHLHNIHGYYINLELLFEYIKKSKKPVVWTLHDCWAFTGHCSHFDYIGCKKWMSEGCNNCVNRKSYPKSMFLDNSSKNYKFKSELFNDIENLTIVVPSEWLGNLVKKSFLNKYPIKVINNGIDLSVFKPVSSDFRHKYMLQNKKIILGVASSWGKSKGFYDFIKLNEMKTDNETIVLVGLTEEQIKLLPKGIVGIPTTSSVEYLAEIYSSADVFVNLTYQDTYPTVNLEAQACGTPVVTYATGGSPESVPVENVVRQGDLAAVIKRVHEIYNEESGIFEDVSRFSRYDRFAEYIELYKKL